jgi:hypothetical protein
MRYGRFSRTEDAEAEIYCIFNFPFTIRWLAQERQRDTDTASPRHTTSLHPSDFMLPTSYTFPLRLAPVKLTLLNYTYPTDGLRTLRPSKSDCENYILGYRERFGALITAVIIFRYRMSQKVCTGCGVAPPHVIP